MSYHKLIHIDKYSSGPIWAVVRTRVRSAYEGIRVRQGKGGRTHGG